MGMGTNIVFITFVISIFFFLAGAKSGAMLMADFLSGNWESGEVKYSTLFQNIFITPLTAGAGAAIVATLFGRSASGALTVAAVTAIVSFAGMPISVFTQESLPWEIKLLLGGIFSVLYMLSVIGFTRGYDF